MFICIIVCYFRTNAQIITKERQQYGTIYFKTEVDSFAHFPGGAQALFDYIASNFRVTMSVQDEAGRHTWYTLVTFIVDSNGSISEIILEEPLEQHVPLPPSLEKELRRVFMNMSNWYPGKKATEK